MTTAAAARASRCRRARHAPARTRSSASTTARQPPRAPLAAWTPEMHHRPINPPYAWVAQLTAGYTPERDPRLRAAPRTTENAAAPDGNVADRRLGDRRQRLHPRLRADGRPHRGAAGQRLRRVGGHRRRRSSSSRPSVRAGRASRANHVVGIRSVVENGGLTTDLAGLRHRRRRREHDDHLRQGKRCWINKVIFHEPPASPDGHRTAT